ncbi:MAG TPA: hypothetical protein DEB52_16840 [Hyphomonas sp.]|nr:hypothetical protein [Hyphomonas sp.]HBT37603.1 hypothetical protein [Hyphomonas sp.]
MIRKVIIQETAVTGSIKPPRAMAVSLASEPFPVDGEAASRDRYAPLAPSARRLCECGARVHLRNAWLCDTCRAAKAIQQANGGIGA